MNALILLITFTSSFQTGLHFWLSRSYLFGLSIDYLSPILYLTDLLLLILFIQKPLLFSFLKSRLHLTLAFLTLFTINLVWSHFPLLTLISISRLALFLNLFIAIIYSNLAPKSFLTALSFSLVIQLIVVSLQLINQSSLSNYFYLLGERRFILTTPGVAKLDLTPLCNFLNLPCLLLRPYGTFSHPNSLSGYSLLALISFWHFRLSSRHLLAPLLLIFLTFSRMTFLGLCLYLIFKFLYQSKKLLTRPLIPITSVLVLLIAILQPILLVLKTTSNTSLQDRLYLLKTSLALFSSQPLFGYGYQSHLAALTTLPQLNLSLIQPAHHALPLILLDFGLVSLIVILTLLFTPSKKSSQSTSIKKLFSSLTHLPIKVSTSTLLPILLALSPSLFFDHYWYTLIQNQLLLFITAALFLRPNPDTITS